MLLAVDVGNTQTHIGAFEGEILVGDWRFATRGDSTADELALALVGSLQFRGLELSNLDGAIVSTVVPRLGPEYERLCEQHLEAPCLLIGPAVRTGMPILIDNPRELGSDRLVNAVAAYDKVGGRCLSVDFGTSINFDAVSADGEYLGASSAPAWRSPSRRSPAVPRSCRGSRSPSRPRRSAATLSPPSSRASPSDSPASSTASRGGSSPSSASRRG